MVSDSELGNRLRKILLNSDLDTATASSVRRQLEEEFGLNLYDRRSFIREQIDNFLQTRFSKPPQNDDKKEDGQVEEEGGNDGEIEQESESVYHEKNGNSGSQELDKEEQSDEVKSKKKRSRKTDKHENTKGTGFSKPCAISPKLQEIVGVPEMARTEVVKKIWAYIREKNLQNPKDKRKIICDETLRGLFRVKSINMFQMNKALSNHIWPIDAEDEQHQEDQEKEEEDGNVEEIEEQSENVKQEENNGSRYSKEEGSRVRSKKKSRSRMMDKNDKIKGTGFTKPCAISPQLQEIVGVPEMARTEVVKKIWAYIRKKNLQNPMDKRKIICDETLQGVFRVKSIDMFQMNKALSKHVWPIDG